MKPPVPPCPDLSGNDFNVFDLSKEELNAAEAPKVKWHCCVEGCNRYSRVKDFGVLPKVWWKNHWVDLTAQVLYCGKHWKLFRAQQKKGMLYEPMEGYKPGSGINHLTFTSAGTGAGEYDNNIVPGA